MKVNGKDIEQFDAIFISFLPAISNITSNIFISNENHIDNGMETQTQTRELVVVFDKEISLSYFVKEFLNRSIIEFDEFIYDCLLLDTPSVMHIGRGIVQVTFRFSAIRKKPLITQYSQSFMVEGTYKTDCIYEITSSAEFITFTVDGYTVKNIKANRTFIIDGIDKLIYYKDKPDYSEFDNTDLVSFPKLDIGQHTVIKSDSTVNVVVKYYPIFM